ncbi:MAG: hypothetical protein IJO65_09150 [Lachnospiraceae bacterium]|nr:hypothetical protein [Lachnospiraceae bacterium]
MYQYTLIQWLFFFYFYCFFGWVFESTYVSLKKKQFVNRGFMRGPFLPIYGSGGIMMLVASMPFQDNIFMTYIAGCIGATALELFTGVTMEALFKVRYWDYSDQKFNFKGHICLSSTIAWGFLTILMTELLHKGVERVVLSVPYNVLSVVTVVLSVIILMDFTLSFKAAMDLRDVLIRLEKAREEMERIQKRLDVIIAVASDEIENRKQESEERAEELMNRLEARFDRVKERLLTQPGEFLDDVRDEIAELKSKYLAEKEYRLRSTKIRDFYKRNLFHSNPSMSSARFHEALEELKKAVEDYKKK